MVDIGTELQKNIEKDFNERVAIDAIIRGIIRKIDNDRANQADIPILCRRLGGIATDVLTRNIKHQGLPNETMYWNIAEKSIKPLMIKIHDIVNETAELMLENDYKTKGVGIKVVKPAFPEERIDSLINNFVKAYNTGIEEDE